MSDLGMVGEGSSFVVTIRPRDKATDSPVTFSTMKYRIDCLTTGRTVRDWTDLTPSASVELQITDTDNAIVDDANRRERKQLTLVGNDGLSTQFVDPDPARWWVNNTLPGRNVVP